MTAQLPTSTWTADDTAAPFFTAVVEDFRGRFLLPGEQVGLCANEEIDALIADIQIMKGGPGTDAVLRLAEGYPRRNLSLLYPALLRADDPATLARIVRILEIRVTGSLLDLGWAYYQNYFTDGRLSSAFTALHGKLRRKDPNSRVFLPAFDSGPFDEALPAKVFAAMTVQGIKQVEPFFETSGILPDTAFARAVLVLFFSSCADAGLVDNSASFVRMLPELGEEDGAKVMLHYLREHRLGPMYRELNQGILSAVGPPDSGHPVWQNVPEVVRARYWKWLVARSVEDHLSENPRKFGLLVRYVPYMESVRLISDDILVMGFGNFYLVDDKRTPKLCYYYEKAVFEMWLETLVSEPAQHEETGAEQDAGAEEGTESGYDSAMPSVPTQMAKRIVMEDIRASAVLLDFPEVGVLFARDFLDGVLGIGKRGKEVQQGRLF